MQPGNLIIEKKVKSKTSNNEYLILIYDNCLVCTCPAGGKRQLCKHLISTIYENLEILQQNYPDYTNDLLNLIEIKQNKNLSREEKQIEYAKFIYSNKEIATAAHLNSVEIKNSDLKELDEIKNLCLSDEWLAKNFYNFFHQARNLHYSLFISEKNETILKLEKLGYITFQNINYEEIKKYDINNYYIFSATEKLTTNKLIPGFALQLKQNEYKNTKNDIGIKFLKEDCNIILK